MFQFSLRKIASISAATVLVASGAVLGLGSSVASAEPACARTQSVTSSWAGSLWTPYTLSKEVSGDGTAAAGHTVTYVTRVSGSGSLVNEIRDYHPLGFQLVSARLNVKWLIGDQAWEDVTGTAQVGNNSVVVTGAGWTTAGGGIIALETTYKIPADVPVGTVLNSGAGTNIVLAAGGWTINPMGVCVTIRPPNPVEIGTGSLDAVGLGSINAGSGQVFGSVTDPQGSISNIIGDVLGNVLGNMS